MLPVHDLRRVLVCARASRPAGEEGEGSLSPETPSSPADGDDENEGSDEDDEPGEDEPLSKSEIRNPRIKSLTNECARYRTAAKAEKERADTAETTVSELRRHNAFLVAAAGKVTDLEAAWKLADQSAVTVADDGTVTGFDDVIASTLDRYPYLVPDDEPMLPFQPLPTVSSGKPNARRIPVNDPNRRVLESRFPALKHR